MNTISKGKSPFYPGQPVSIEFFTGRIKEIQRIARAIGQVGLGKPQAIFLTGEYGIGKSSLANFMKYYGEEHNKILGIHVFLGNANNIDDVAAKTVETVIKTHVYEPTIPEKIRKFLSEYISTTGFFGFIDINFKKLKADSPNISHGFLPFLNELFKRVKEDGIKGIMLIFDEINGITGNAQFSHFIKALIDENAISQTPLPLLLMLCGVEVRRREMILHHQPIERIFDIIEIEQMSEDEMRNFFNKTFESVGITVEKKAMNLLCRFSGGFPKIMHIIGDSIFWIDKDNVINKDDATYGIFIAAEDIGKKFVDQQVYQALKSKDYHSILVKLGEEPLSLSFQKGDIERKLTVGEKKKFNNFLQRMKKLKVLKSGDIKGEYIFNNLLIKLYIQLNSLKTKT